MNTAARAGVYNDVRTRISFVALLLALIASVLVVGPTTTSAQAFIEPETDNFAVNATVTQSSLWPAGEPENAIDGLTNGRWAEGSVALTNLDLEAWWEADLGAIETIPQIKIWSRTDCCTDRLADFSVFVSDVPFASTDLATTQAQAGVSEYYIADEVELRELIDVDRTGRYVRVQLHGTNYLQLAEVQIGGPWDEISHEVTPTWGVRTRTPSLDDNIEAEVFAIEQIGNTIYVGGKFEEVVEHRFSVGNDQPYLAAFDATTGEWLDWWRPQLNGAVWSLEASPDGTQLFVGGEFYSVDDLPNTGALVVLDPATGLVDRDWVVHLSRFWAPGPASVKGIAFSGDGWVYAGGNFTHAASLPSYNRINFDKVARFSLADGTVDPNWDPVVTGGAVYNIAVSPDDARVYLAGQFSAVNGEPDSENLFAVNNIDGEAIPGLPRFPWNSTVNETFDVIAYGDKVFVGGSQHQLVATYAADYSVINRVYTTGGGGDMQDLELVGDRIYGTCHCRGTIWDAALNSGTPGATNEGGVTGFWAVDANTGGYIDTFPTSELEFELSAGGWAIHGAADGCLWLGGDINREAIGDQFVNSLAKMCPETGAGAPAGPPLTEPTWDAVPPSTPSGLVATVDDRDVDLTWTGSTDNDQLAGYAIYRDGVLAAKSYETEVVLQDEPSGTFTYTVTALDRTNNESAVSGGVVASVADVPGQFDVVIDASFNQPYAGIEFDGFTYEDDLFRGTANPEWTFGLYTPDGVITDSGAPVIKIGGHPRPNIVETSGGWTTDFTLAADTELVIELTYRVLVPNQFKADEYVEALLALDGTLYGTGGNDYLIRQTDGGDTGYVTSVIDLGVVAAGTHTLEMGAFLNEKDFSYSGYRATVVFDDVLLSPVTPGLDVVTPLGGDIVQGFASEITIGSLDADDLDGSLTVEFSVDGGVTWSPATWNAATGLYESTWDTTVLADGPATIDVRSTDADTNVATSSVAVTVANLAPPVVAIDTPTAGAQATGSVLVVIDAADAIDPDGSLTVEVSGDGQATWVPATWNAATSRYEATWDSTTVGDGATILEARATDSDTLSAIATVSVNVNNLTSYDELVDEDGATVHWRLGDAGTTAVDHIGGVDGTYVNGPTVGEASLVPTESDTAVSFDGSDDVVEIPDSSLINTSTRTAGTWELWFNANDVTSRQVLYEQGGNTRGVNLYVEAGEVHLGAWNTNNDGADTPWVSGPAFVSAPIQTATTYHVLLAYDVATDRIEGFVNGVSIGIVNGIGGLYYHGSDIGIGAMNGNARWADGTTSGGDGYEFAGTIDEVAIYPTGLSASDAEAHYLTGLGVSDAPPTVQILAPGAGTVASGTVAVSASAQDLEDPAGTLTVEFSDDAGATWTSMSFDAGAGAYELNWDSTSVADGMTDLQVRATDSANNVTLATATVDVHNAAPTYADIVIADGPIAYWRLGEAAGTSAFDSVGSIDATYESGVALGSTSLVAAETDTAATFDGVDDVVAVPDSNLINTTTRTEESIELWFEATDTSARQTLFDQGGTSRGLNIYIQDGLLYIGGWNTNNDSSPDTPWAAGPVFLSAPVDAATTYHVVLVYDQPNDRFEGYLNGVSFGVANGIGTLHSHSSDTGIGAVNDATRYHTGGAGGDRDEFAGTIDDVSLYGYALDTATVQTHYLAGLGTADAAPSLTIAAPNTGDTVSGVVTVMANAADIEDAAGTLTVEFSVNAGATWSTMAYNAGSGSYEAGWDSTTVADGPATIDVRVTDSTNNVVIDNVAVDVMNAAPLYQDVVLADAPATFWRLGEAAGTTAVDNSGNGVDGTYVGGVTLGEPGLVTGSDTAARFDGIDDVVEIPDSTFVNLGTRRQQHSIELWFNADDVNTRSVIYEQGGATRGASIYVDGGMVYIGVWNAANDGSNDTPWASGPVFLSSAVTANTTYHVVLTFDRGADEVVAYVDGVSVGSVNGIGYLYAHGSDTGIGAMNGDARFHDGTESGDGYYFAGVIDEVAVYSSTLTPTEVADHYNVGTN